MATLSNISKNSASLDNISKSGVLSELWSTTYLPWEVTAYPWLNENTTTGTPLNNLTKS